MRKLFRCPSHLLWLATALTTFLSCPALHAQQGVQVDMVPADLKKLSIEELMNLEVTTVSKKEESVNQVPAAVHVITQEDIRRSAARSIPEALRLAPNLQVAQINSHDWAITARGFNGAIANKLLVMIDGRSVYTPLFSGVFWDVQDTFMEDIDRIEVVSGPGGTLWGANAVNGVINVVTKSAKQTAGGLVTATGGTERLAGGLRYGAKVTDDVSYRVYAKFFDRDSTVFANGANGQDDWRMGQAGFRTDWDISDSSLLTVQGDGYGGRENQLAPGNVNLAGGNILARWTRTFSEDAQFTAQAYYDRTHRVVPNAFGEDLDTYDIDAQHRFKIGEHQDILLGLGYRFTKDNVKNSPALAILPAKLERNVFSTFVQDEISVLPDRLALTLGSKFELNDYTGFEFQPSGRLRWNNEKHVAWAAISRAVRTPSRIDRHFFVPGTPPFTLLAGGPEFDSEKLIAYELGYRVQPREDLYATVSTFFNDYNDLRSVRPGPPAMVFNDIEGETYGAELEIMYQPLRWWRLSAGYTWIEEHLRVKPGQVDINAGRAETSDPEQQILLRSAWDLPRNFQLDVIGRFVDQLQTVFGGPPAGAVSSYIQLDVRLGWTPRKDLELAIIGQNLLDDRHPEFGVPSPLRHEIERGVYGTVTWRF